MRKERSRPVSAALFLVTVGLGLASRLPRLGCLKDLGDVLYATMAFWLVGLLWPRGSTGAVAGAALAYCFAIEAAKLLEAPSVVAMRHHWLGHLILGTGFHASNLICYTVGALIGAGLEHFPLRRIAWT